MKSSPSGVCLLSNVCRAALCLTEATCICGPPYPRALGKASNGGRCWRLCSNQGGVKSALTGVAATKVKERVDSIIKAVRIA